MKYLPLFEISVGHSFYEDGHCPDVRVVANAATAVLLGKHRAVVKDRPSGAVVLVPVDDEGLPVIAFPAGASATFEIRVDGDEFHWVTDRTGMPAMHIDVPGLSTLVPALTPAAYPVTFTAKSARWVYYVVTDVAIGAGTGVVTIADTGASPVLFGTTNIRDLAALPDNSDPVAKRLAARYPSKRLLRFVSDAAITMSEQARKYLELRVDGSTVQEFLPNPSLDVVGRINVGSPAAAADTVYSVIEHFAQNTAMPAN
jgi:hypothetical protein